MTDILTEIIKRRSSDMESLGANFGFDIPSVRKRKVHPFLEDCDGAKRRGVILEVKRASPSKGDIAPDLDAGKTALSYAHAGAAAISCLTEKNFFKGSLEDLMNVCGTLDSYESQSGCTIPAVLRKDFLQDEGEIEVSYRAGADAVLLIARILESDVMVKMAEKAASYGMTSLVEVRNDRDLDKLTKLVRAFDSTGRNKRLIACGVNSRDLADFKIDLLKPCSMLSKIKAILGADSCVIFESGIRSPRAASFVGEVGFSGLLLGESAAKNPDMREGLVKSFVQADATKNADFWKKYAVTLQDASCKVKVKICGLTRVRDLLYADSLGADFVGFIFADGFDRNVSGEKFQELVPALSNVRAIKTAVITDLESPQAKEAISFVERGILDCLQLHGIPCEKVPEGILSLPHYFAITDRQVDLEGEAEKLFLMGEARFLQDSKSQAYSSKHKLWMAGGVTAENAGGLTEKYRPELIDLSSGIEDEGIPGIKNHEKMKLLMDRLKSVPQ